MSLIRFESFCYISYTLMKMLQLAGRTSKTNLYVEWVKKIYLIVIQQLSHQRNLATLHLVCVWERLRLIAHVSLNWNVFRQIILGIVINFNMNHKKVFRELRNNLKIIISLIHTYLIISKLLNFNSNRLDLLFNQLLIINCCNLLFSIINNKRLTKFLSVNLNPPHSYYVTISHS